MHYEINVAKNGNHFFATHQRSIDTLSKAKTVFRDFTEAFPTGLGFTITVTRWSECGQSIPSEDLMED